MSVSLRKIDCKDLRLGMRYSAPVFFEDGKNMFLAPGKEVKPYHLFAIKRWNINFLITTGDVLPDDSVSAKSYDDPLVKNYGNLDALDEEDDVSDLEELEEVNDSDDVIEELESVDDTDSIEELEGIDDTEEIGILESVC
ncbi:MAG: hypothetical protein K6F69_01690 [Treponema sp.]|nr:hypothetical protein [Treponema sp.]